MRLYKPRLFTQGVTAGSLLPTTLSAATATQHEFAMSSALILPDSFGCVASRDAQASSERGGGCRVDRSL